LKDENGKLKILVAVGSYMVDFERYSQNKTVLQIFNTYILSQFLAFVNSKCEDFLIFFGGDFLGWGNECVE